MSDLKLLIITFVSPSESKESQEEAKRILLGKLSSKELSIHQLIDLLGPELTHDDNIRRARGMSLLAAALYLVFDYKSDVNIDVSKINAIVSFLKQRLDDYYTQNECVDAFYALLLSTYVVQHLEKPQDIIQAIIRSERLHIQSLPQSSRRKIFEILAFVLDARTEEIVSLKDDLVFGFIQAMDGESDPRNLTLCFDLFVNIVLKSPGYMRFEEDLFEITSCYFPVTFTEKPNLPSGVKKIDLVVGLRRTMIASPKFWIPFLLDKLTSSIIETKMEVLSNLHFAFTDMDTRKDKSLWDIDTVEPLLEKLRQSILNEILQSTDTTVQASGLQCIASLTRWIAQVKPQLLTDFLEPLLSLGLQNLNEGFDNKILTVSAKMLQACTAASRCSARIILDRILPVLLDKYMQEGDVIHKAGLIRLVANFTKSTVKVAEEDISQHPVAPYSRRLLEIFKATAHNQKLQIQERSDAVDILSTLLTLNKGNLLKHEDVCLVEQLFTNTLLSYETHGFNVTKEAFAGLRSTLLQALVNISYYHFDVISSQTLPRITEELELRIQEGIATSSTEPMAVVNIPQDYLKHIPTLEELIMWLSAFGDPSGTLNQTRTPSIVLTRHESKQSNQLSYDKRIIYNIQNVFVRLVYKYFDYIPAVGCILSHVNKIVNSREVFMVLLNLILVRYKQHPETFKAIYRHLPELLLKVMNTLNHENQVHLIKTFYEAFLEGRTDRILVIRSDNNMKLVSDLLINNASLIEESNSVIFNPIQNADDRVFLSLFSSVFINAAIHEYDESLYSSIVDIIQHSIRQLFNILTSLEVTQASSAYGSLDIEFTCKGLASLLNKVRSDDTFEAFLSQTILHPLRQQMDTIERDQSLPSEYSTIIYHILVWCTKALIQKNGKIRVEFWNLLQNQIYLSHPDQFDTKRNLIQLFQIMFVNIPYLPLLSPLYKQRFFLTYLPKAISIFNQSEDNPKQQSIILLSLSGLLQGLPKGVLLETAQDVIPLLLKSIDSHTAELRQETVTTFAMLAELDQSIIEQHLSSIIKAMIRLSQDVEMSNMKTRYEAVRCLLSIQKFPFQKIYPYKDTVIHGLLKVLDDPKRMVRQMAVKCKNEWIVMFAQTKK